MVKGNTHPTMLHRIKLTSEAINSLPQLYDNLLADMGQKLLLPLLSWSSSHSIAYRDASKTLLNLIFLNVQAQIQDERIPHGDDWCKVNQGTGLKRDDDMYSPGRVLCTLGWGILRGSQMKFANIASAASETLPLTSASAQTCSLPVSLASSHSQNALFCCPIECLLLKMRITWPRDAAHAALVQSRGVYSVALRYRPQWQETCLCVKDQECRGSNCRDADKNFLSFRLSVLLADKYRSPNTENTKQNQTYLKPLGRIVSGTQTEMRLSSGKFQEACGCTSTMESSVVEGGGLSGWGGGCVGRKIMNCETIKLY